MAAIEKKKRNSHKHKAPSEVIRIEDGCPAIVSKELWERANIARKFSSANKTNAKYSYLLSSLLYCEECGAKLHGNHRRYGDNGYNTYRCNKKDKQLTCHAKEIKTDPVDQFVLDTFCKFFFTDGLAEILTKQINKTMKELLRNGNEEVVMARKALQGLKIVQKNLVETIANTGYNHSFVDKLNATEKQIAKYESMIAAENAKHTQHFVSIEEVNEQIKKILCRSQKH